jgi:hypothetical protein
VNGQRAALRLNDLAGNGQPQADAAASPAAARSIRLKKPFENALLVFRRDPDAALTSGRPAKEASRKV